MSYIPHSVRASTGALYGNIENTRIKDLRSHTGRGKAQEFPIYVDVSIVNHPGNKKLHGIRFMGLLSLVVNQGGEEQTAVGAFDDLINKARNRHGGDLVAVENEVAGRLNGRVVTPTNVGGRWIVQ